MVKIKEEEVRVGQSRVKVLSRAWARCGLGMNSQHHTSSSTEQVFPPPCGLIKK